MNKIKKNNSISGRAPIHPLSLSFNSKALRDDYSRNHVQQSLKLARLGLILGLVLYILYSFLDRNMVPETASRIFIIRITECLFFLMVFSLTFNRLIYRYYQLLMSLLAFAAGMGIIWMILISDTPGGIHYYAGLILVIMYAHGVLRIRFIYASLTTWIIILLYELYIFINSNMPTVIALNNTFFLTSANLLGMFSSYGLEYYMRTVFWQKRALNEKSAQLMEEHNRKSNELEAVRQIQLAMLPQRIPVHPEIELSVSMKTASEIGGDYYDFHVSEDGTLTFAVGDATGHGAQAGAMVTATKFLFSNYAAHQDPVEFLQGASRALIQMRLPRLYITLAIGRIKDSILEIAGAGLPPLLIFRENTGIVEEIPLKGIPLGGYGSEFYQKRMVNLSGGDSLVLMTDGFPEQFNSKGEELGYDKAKEIFEEIAKQSPAEIIQKLNEKAGLWMNGAPQHDDMTFLVLRIKNDTHNHKSRKYLKTNRYQSSDKTEQNCDHSGRR